MLTITKPSTWRTVPPMIASEIVSGTVFYGEFIYLTNHYSGFFLKVGGHFVALDRTWMWWDASPGNIYTISNYRECSAELIIR